MTPDRFERIAQVFEAVVERPLRDRAGLVAELCGDDDELRHGVDDLLAADAAADGFLESGAFDPAMSSEAVDPDAAIGQRIGPYRVIRAIGQGGMGTVFLAGRDDDAYQKRVAIKVINRGMDSDSILRRFRNERQILARLDHPNIARLHDGGSTADARPYFVMEYLEGRPITEYCNAKRLAIHERLKLFVTVCAAVHYAHQNLVIHRDLKPNNVIVTCDGVPKLLDFGIAKLLGTDARAEGAETETHFRILTPEYASPEQIRGEVMTTASDVYGLGVLLYEILTRRRPYCFTTRQPDEIARLIGERDPPKPSTTMDGRLGRQVRGDLDNIVLMAMQRDPRRRYGSVEQLAQDIARFLERQPIIAHAPTLAYRSARFVQRHRLAVAAGAVIVVTLAGGVVSTTRQARRAERRLADVMMLARSVMFELHDAIEVLPGSTGARAVLVERVLQHLDDVARDTGMHPRVQRELATAYEKLGDVQSRLHRSNLGNTPSALESYQKALAIRQSLFAADDTDLQTRLDLALSYGRTGDMLSKTNDATGALAHYRTSLRLIEDALRAQPQHTGTRDAAATGHVALGRALLKVGEFQLALAAFRRGAGLYEALIAEDPAGSGTRQRVIASYQGIAFALASTGDAPGSLALYRRSVSIAAALSDRDPSNAAALRTLMDAHEWLALALRQNGDLADALDHHHRARVLALTLLGRDPGNAQAHNDIGDIYHELGNTLTAMGDIPGALGLFRESLQHYETVSLADPTDTNARRQVSATRRQMANALLIAGSTVAALAEHRAALRVFIDLGSGDRANIETQHDIALSYRAIGNALAASAETADALEAFGRALPILARLSENAPLNTSIRADLADVRARIGTLNSWQENKRKILSVPPR